MSYDNDNLKEEPATPEQMLESLARELKHPLTFIARQAESSLDQNHSLEALAAIVQSASSSMMLIDSYLLSARSEYGQQQLPLEPIGIGSVLYDVAHSLCQTARNQNCTLEVDTRHAGPVMAHAAGLRAALTCIISQLLLCEPEEPAPRIIRLSGYKQYANEPVAAVFDPLIQLSQKDISAARHLQGKSHMALGSLSRGSGVHLAIAESLAQSLGARLRIVRHQGVAGFGLRLLKSEQLQLV